jgi:hypothetical protein
VPRWTTTTTTTTTTPWKKKMAGDACGWPTQSALDEEKQEKQRVGKEEDGKVGIKRIIAKVDRNPVETYCVVSLVVSIIEQRKKQATACFKG